MKQKYEKWKIHEIILITVWMSCMTIQIVIINTKHHYYYFAVNIMHYNSNIKTFSHHNISAITGHHWNRFWKIKMNKNYD